MSMDYKLVRELRDAGFAEGGKGTWIYPLDALVTRSSDRVYAPTLEELIEACGDDFHDLQNFNWKYGGWGVSSKRTGIQKFGDTPTEAVARLWLALNTKT